MVYLKFTVGNEEVIEYEYGNLEEAMWEAFNIDSRENNAVLEIVTEDSIYVKEDIVRYWEQNQWIHKF